MDLNALTNDDKCPNSSVTIILPCSHACGATCLFRFQREYENNKEDDDRVKFWCVVCRRNIPKNAIQQVAHELFNERLISSFNVFVRKLPFETQEFEELIVSL